MRAVRADSPSTGGTLTRRGPRLTQTRTLRCAFSVPPGGGSCATMRSAGTDVVAPALDPQGESALGGEPPASGSARPTSDGTATSCEVSTTRMVMSALATNVARRAAPSSALRATRRRIFEEFKA